MQLNLSIFHLQIGSNKTIHRSIQKFFHAQFHIVGKFQGLQFSRIQSYTECVAAVGRGYRQRVIIENFKVCNKRITFIMKVKHNCLISTVQLYSRISQIQSNGIVYWYCLQGSHAIMHDFTTCEIIN